MGKTLALTPEQRAQYEAAGLLWWYETTYEGKELPIHPDQPLRGYFRWRDGALAPWVPADTWIDQNTGEMRGAVGFRDKRTPLDLEALKRIWPYLARERVTYEAWDAAMTSGEWPVARGGFKSNSDAAELPEKPTGWEALKHAISVSTTEALEWLKQFEKDTPAGPGGCGQGQPDGRAHLGLPQRC